MKKRKQPAENKKKEKEAKSQAKKEKQDDWLFFLISKNLIQLLPDLIYGLHPVIPRHLSKNKKQDDFIFQNDFYNLLQFILNIFVETVIGDLGLKKSVQSKGKSVSRK